MPQFNDVQILGLKAYKAERIFDYESAESFNHHLVVVVFAGGEPRVNDRGYRLLVEDKRTYSLRVRSMKRWN